MHFLFVSSFLGPTVGGLETLMARMSKWLFVKGHRVTLLVNCVPDECRELFVRGVAIKELGNRLSQFCYRHKALSLWKDLGIERPDVIKAFDLPSTWIVSVLAAGMEPVPKVIFGNYFPYVIPRNPNPFRFATYKLYLHNVTKTFFDESILCISEEQITEFRYHYGQYRNPIFWTLPVEDPSHGNPVREPEHGRIVSVGRLSPMKEYNLYMTDVVARLRQKGYPVTWTVYGEGEFFEAMRARIHALGLGGVVELKGNLPYTRFAEAMRNAYVFVGMGTSAIEAAMCGVPSVVALAYDTKGVTHGCLYEYRFGNCGVIMENAPMKTVESEIERILGLPAVSYEQEMLRTRDYAGAYSLDPTMERFLEIARKAPAPRTIHLFFYWYYIHRLMEQTGKRLKGKGSG